MRAGREWRHVAFGAVLTVSALVGWTRETAGTYLTPAATQGAAPETDAALFRRLCADCHELNTVTGTRRERQQWLDVIDEMYLEGAKGTDEEFATVLKYLLAQYGRVNVNRAPAEDFVAVLSLSEADAGRIVAYRKTHGPFETFESLLKVPDIDVEKIKTQRNAIGL